MTLIGESKTTVQKSKFYGYLFETKTKKESENNIKCIESQHKKARHICTATLIKNNQEKFEKFKNDQEVGHPGKTLLNLLKHHNLKNHTLIVVRYFGGIKLGPGGVTRAFKECGELCINIKTT